ncbi:hypothetical protein FQN51_002900 [Onygenales sp. PD_10]|nr:hypothetical protein FQN51_002900 [Onygenales sp. PD_10]
MTSRLPNRDDPINIVGAGIFGLSTAIHLARRGYTKVTVFDKQLYDETRYSYLNGCDAASADINKIIRSAYGGQTEYQDLAIEALSIWNSWNDEIASGKTVPPGMTTADRVFINNGHMVLTDADSLETLPAFEAATIAGMEAAGYKDTQLITADPRHQEIAKSKGLESAMNAFRRKDKNKVNVGVLDITGGLTVADKACCFALCKARSLGVNFVLGSIAGEFQTVYFEPGTNTKAVGIKTRDGTIHPAAMNIVACGGWTPSLIPELDGLCEATAGSVALLKIPRESPLFSRLGPDRFPSWQYKMRDGAEGGLYGFPRDDDGWFKVGYRGTKYTNPVKQDDGKERSVPITRWSSPSTEASDRRIKAVPKQALKVIQSFLDDFVPELATEGIKVSLSRICWYTDSYDNHFVIDRVPGRDGLMVATGGSGHAFKYLPIIGSWVVDVLEGVGLERPGIKACRWRKLEAGVQPGNVLMEGSRGSRALGNVPLSSDTELSRGGRPKL